MSLRWRIAQGAELRWWRNYLRGKDPGQYLQWKKEYWQCILRHLQGFVEIDISKTICDIGCGPAGIFIALTENKVVALDPLGDDYEKVFPFFSKKNFTNVTFISDGIETFHPEKKFDIVFCMNAINHVQDIEKGFDKLKEICAKNGSLILSVDAHRFSFLKYIFRFIPLDVLHPHQYDLDEYQSFLEKRGMKILKTELLKGGVFFNHYLLVASFP